MMRQLPAALISLLSLATLVISHPTEHSTPAHTHTWRKVVNALIPRIWSSPPRQGRLSADSEEHHHVVSHAAGRYARDVVLRFNLTSIDQALAIKEVADDLYLDIWEYTQDWVDIRVAKDVVPSLLNLLPASLSTSYAPLIPESALLSLISSSTPSISSKAFSPALRSTSKDLFFADYQPLSVIYPWLKLLSTMFSSHARIITIGKSFEGRDILGIRVSHDSSKDDKPSGPRKTILVTGGTHAREWISTSSVNYLAWTLITSLGKSATESNFITTFDWIFVPVMNPDGYEYTWTTDRLWRKNRQPTPLRFCNGIDLDRSYGFKFDQGTAGNPCAETYAGQEPWEATESTQMRDWARNETESGTTFVALLDLHSYSQQVLYPYSYSCDVEPPTVENLEELAFGLVKAMYHSAHGATYRPGPACEGNVAVNAKGEKTVMPRLETGGGSAIDWFYNELNVKYSYQIKLRDTGSYGFLLPKDQIVPTGREVVAAAEWIGKFLRGEIGMMDEDEVSVAEKEEDKVQHILEAEEHHSTLTKLEFRRRR